MRQLQLLILQCRLVIENYVRLQLWPQLHRKCNQLLSINYNNLIAIITSLYKCSENFLDRKRSFYA